MTRHKTCLIIGPGDLGQRIAQKMYLKGYQVFTLNRNTTSLPREYISLPFDFTLNKTSLSINISFDCVFFTAAPDKHDHQSYLNIYLNSLKKVNRILKQAKHVLFASSTAVYHQNNGSLVNENSATQPTGFSGQVMLQAEQWITAHIEHHTIVRLSGLYSNERHPINRILHADTHFKWNRISNRIHLEDAANMFVFLSELNFKESIFIGSDSHPVMYWDIGKWLYNEKRKPWTIDKPKSIINKKLSNNLIQSKGFSFIYPSYKEGLTQCI